MAFGDHVKVFRPLGHDHHGIDIGGGWIIHFSGEKKTKADAVVCVVRKATFANGGTIKIVAHGDDCYSPAETVLRALSLLGWKGYNLFDNNCEHFVLWCKTGKKECRQMRRLIFTGAGMALVRYAPRLLSRSKTIPLSGWGLTLAVGLAIFAACTDETRPDDTPKIGW